VTNEELMNEVDFSTLEDLLFDYREKANKSILFNPLNAIMTLVILVSAYLYTKVDKHQKGF
jgi:hypothetical protein